MKKIKRRDLTLYEFHIKPIARSNAKTTVIENVCGYDLSLTNFLKLYKRDNNGLLTEQIIDLYKVDYVVCYKNNQFERYFRA